MSEVQQGIEERVKRIVAEQVVLDVESVRLDATLDGDLGFDDLDLVEMTMAVEDEFGIYIDDAEMAAFTTVKSIVDYVTVNVKA